MSISKLLIPLLSLLLLIAIPFTNSSCAYSSVSTSNSIEVDNPDASIIGNTFVSGSTPAPGSFDEGNPDLAPLSYFGGHIIHSPHNIYFLWYGDFDTNKVDTLTYLIQNLPSTDYLKIFSNYYEDKLPSNHKDYKYIRHVDINVNFISSSFDNYSLGKDLSSITNDYAFTILSNNITNNNLSLDPDGIYFVIIAQDVITPSPGFCDDYCGYHNNQIIQSSNIIYALIGDSDSCLSSCTSKDKYIEYGFPNSPNFDFGTDGMASVMTHELSEILTDPNVNINKYIQSPNYAWLGDDGLECADKCAWTFGTLYLTNNNSVANVKIGTKDFLIQQNWVLDNNGGRCDLQL